MPREINSPTLLVAGVLLIVFSVFGLPVAFLLLLEWLSVRIIARSPSECWSYVVEGEDRGG